MTLRISLFLFVTGFLTAGCENSSTGFWRIENNVSRSIHLSGEKITTVYSAWPVPEGDKPAIDTTDIAFLMTLKLSTVKEDSVRIYGLEGADVGKYDTLVYPNCSHPDDCKVYGRMTSEKDFVVGLNNQGRTFQAIGTTVNISFNLTSRYQFRNVTVEYDLDGFWR